MRNRRQRRSAAQATSQFVLNAFISSALPQRVDPTDDMPEPSAQEVIFAIRKFDAICECEYQHPNVLARLREWCEYLHEIRGWTTEKTIVVVAANAVSLMDIPPPNTENAEVGFTPFPGVGQPVGPEVGFTPFQGVGHSLDAEGKSGQSNLECMD